VPAPRASPPAASSALLALLTRFLNGGSIGDWTVRRLCSFSTHFSHVNGIIAALSKESSPR
jgi:hypothetical protein